VSRFKIIVSILFFAVLITAILVFVKNRHSASGVAINYPFDEALFPPEFPAPTFEWECKITGPYSWNVSLFTENEKYEIVASTKQNSWTPDEFAWDSLKRMSGFKDIHFLVEGSDSGKGKDRISFKISRDSVGAPVLYRQMPIPSFFAEEHLDSMNYMLINFGSKKKPHMAMEGFPVCGNCHSFTDDGRTIGLDLDAGLRDKGGYFIADIEDTIVFSLENYRSWSKLENRSTFGLFSKISPDGRYIVTTVKDRMVFINYDEEERIPYSQLFFPVNGHLAIYDRQTGAINELPGADLDEYVQSNAIWTPDGKSIIFSRSNALPPYSSQVYGVIVKQKQLLDKFTEGTQPYKFELCKIPFNNGLGGEAVPIKGATKNGKSNYFPAISPDGKWLIFCRAKNYMLLQPDSRLYIVPVEGGRARKLACNLPGMNSWHAWSPNGKWIVFVSKALSQYTDMFLSHIDEEGNASIPVLADKARVHRRVVNYPEFVNRDPEKPFVMDYKYVELIHIEKALGEGDIEKAKELYYKLEDQHSYFVREDYRTLSDCLVRMGLMDDAMKYLKLARATPVK